MDLDPVLQDDSVGRLALVWASSPVEAWEKKLRLCPGFLKNTVFLQPPCVRGVGKWQMWPQTTQWPTTRSHVRALDLLHGAWHSIHMAGLFASRFSRLCWSWGSLSSWKPSLLQEPVKFLLQANMLLLIKCYHLLTFISIHGALARIRSPPSMYLKTAVKLSFSLGSVKLLWLPAKASRYGHVPFSNGRHSSPKKMGLKVQI